MFSYRDLGDILKVLIFFGKIRFLEIILKNFLGNWGRKLF